MIQSLPSSRPSSPRGTTARFPIMLRFPGPSSHFDRSSRSSLACGSSNRLIGLVEIGVLRACDKASV